MCWKEPGGSSNLYHLNGSKIFPHLHKLPQNNHQPPNHQLLHRYASNSESSTFTPSAFVCFTSNHLGTVLINRLPPFPATGYNFDFDFPEGLQKDISHHIICPVSENIFPKKKRQKNPLRQTAWFFHSAPQKNCGKLEKTAPGPKHSNTLTVRPPSLSIWIECDHDSKFFQKRHGKLFPPIFFISAFTTTRENKPLGFTKGPLWFPIVVNNPRAIPLLLVLIFSFREQTHTTKANKWWWKLMNHVVIMYGLMDAFDGFILGISIYINCGCQPIWL